MRRAAHSSRCARCGAGAGRSATKYQSRCTLSRQTNNETLRRTSDPGPSPFGYGPPTQEQTRHATQGRRCARKREREREAIDIQQVMSPWRGASLIRKRDAHRRADAPRKAAGLSPALSLSLPPPLSLSLARSFSLSLALSLSLPPHLALAPLERGDGPLCGATSPSHTARRVLLGAWDHICSRRIECTRHASQGHR